jgi:hypothetical protein
MADIKDLGRIVEKWKRKAAASQQDYKVGVQRPRRPWQQATLAAEERWTQAIQEAAARGAFGAGVQGSSDAEWSRGVQLKGVQRWAPGVAASVEKYQRGFAPYAEVIRNLQLPERGPTGDPGNIQRVAVIAEALRNRKLEKKGGK